MFASINNTENGISRHTGCCLSPPVDPDGTTEVVLRNRLNFFFWFRDSLIEIFS